MEFSATPRSAAPTSLAIGSLVTSSETVPPLTRIGYGSGVFLPELAQHCDELHAIDQHAKTAEVACSLRDHQIEAQLRSGSALDLPYESEMFDCIVAVSCLEYMDPLSVRLMRSGEC